MTQPRDLTQSRLASRLIYQLGAITVKEDQVRLPGGQVTTRTVVDHPGAVVIVPLIEPRHVLMVRQYRYAAGTAMLELPAGTLEPGEDPELAAQRELQEEVGMKAGRLIKLAAFYTAPGFCSELMHLYMAADLTPSRLAADDDEDLEVVLLPWDEALFRARRGEIQDAKSLVGILMVAARR